MKINREMCTLDRVSIRGVHGDRWSRKVSLGPDASEMCIYGANYKKVGRFIRGLMIEKGVCVAG
jgi:hypothetical protein